MKATSALQPYPRLRELEVLQAWDSQLHQLPSQTVLAGRAAVLVGATSLSYVGRARLATRESVDISLLDLAVVAPTYMKVGKGGK